MPAESARFQEWSPRLEEAARATGGPIERVHVVRETDSTQDEARRLGLDAGEAVVAWRQTTGRGRLGRAWADTAEEGLAFTAVLDSAPSARLALAGAVAAARAVEAVLAPRGRASARRSLRVGIKWPNDIVVAERKLAGVLVERIEGVALLGIGINVAQRNWPAPLAEIATSLAEIARSGRDVDRLDVACALVESIAATWSEPDASLESEFHARDVLTGTSRTLRCGGERIAGTIVEIDPMSHLRVRVAEGLVRRLPAELTQLER